MDTNNLINFLLPADNRALYDDSSELSRRQYADAFSDLCARSTKETTLYEKLHARLASNFTASRLGQARAFRCFQGVEFLSGENRLYAYRGQYLHQNWNTAFRTVQEAVWLVAWLTGRLPERGVTLVEWLIGLGDPFARLNDAFARIAAAGDFAQRAEESIASAAEAVETVKSSESRAPDLAMGALAETPTLGKFLADPRRIGRHGVTNAPVKFQQIAERIAQGYSKLKEVRTVALISSLAGGCGDEHSDLDLVAFCSEIPANEDRRLAFGQIAQNGDVFSIAGQMDNFCVDGLPGHVLVIPIGAQRHALRHMREGSSPSSTVLVLPAYNFLSCKFLTGDSDMLKEFVRMASVYPDALQRETMIREARFLQRCAEQLNQAACEQDVVSFYLASSFAGMSMAYMLCALNRVHCDDVGLKWSNRVLLDLKKKPAMSEERVEGISLGIKNANMEGKAVQFQQLHRDLLRCCEPELGADLDVQDSMR